MKKYMRFEVLKVAGMFMLFWVVTQCGLIIKYSRATSRVNWLSDEKTNVSRTTSVLVFRVLIQLFFPRLTN
jgi:hypothetical protein